MVSNCPFLPMVSNCPWCQIVRFYPWCQIVRCQIVRGVKLSVVSNCPVSNCPVSNCPRCQIVRGVKLSWCQIVLQPVVCLSVFWLVVCLLSGFQVAECMEETDRQDRWAILTTSSSSKHQTEKHLCQMHLSDLSASWSILLKLLTCFVLFKWELSKGTQECVDQIISVSVYSAVTFLLSDVGWFPPCHILFDLAILAINCPTIIIFHLFAQFMATIN